MSDGAADATQSLGGRRPDQIDVARLAGVSVGSVSNVLNRPEVASAKLRARVQAAMDELGYVPNYAAAALRRGSTPLLGLVIPEVTNAFYAAIADAVVDAADAHGYAVTLCVGHDDPAREQRHFELLAQQRAAGALVVPLAADVTRMSRLRSVGTRLVLVDRLADTAVGCSVSVDDVRGGRLAVAHLLSSAPGTGVTMVNGPREIVQCRERWQGAREALIEARVDPGELVEIVVDDMSIESGLRVARQIIETNAPRRIFCINDQLATGVMEGFAEMGIRIPHDAQIIGYGDLGLEDGHRLSTVGQPKHDLGARAVELLLDELTYGSAHTHSANVFPPHLIGRESTNHKAG